MTRRLVVALALLALSLLALELSLRVLRLPGRAQRTDLVDSRWRPAMDFGAGPGDFWILRRGLADGPVNELGMRGYDPGSTGPHDFRLAILGGGSAYGLELGYEQTFAARVERILQRELPGARVQVMLAAAPDYSSHQMLVAWRRSVRAFAPHVLLIHSEAWNDATPAVGLADADLAASATVRPSLHTLALFARQPAQSGAPRVGLDAYRANLQAMLTEATEADVEVVAATAARGPKATARWPAIAEYARAQAELASAHGAAHLDLHAILTGLDSVGGAAACADIGESMAFRDGVHLTAPAHGVAADVIVPQLRVSRRFKQLSADPSPAPPTLAGIEPTQVTALQGGELTVRGTGLGAGGAPRVYLGATLAARLTPIDDTTFRVALPRDLPPGRLAVAVVTRAGAASLPDALDVRGAAIEATLHRANSRLRAQASGVAPPGSTVQIWLAHAARTQPVATIAGQFWLQHVVVDDRKSAALFCYGNLKLPTTTTTVGPDGTWRIDAELDSPSVMPGTSAALQGVVWLPDRPGHGIATAVLPLPIAH